MLLLELPGAGRNMVTRPGRTLIELPKTTVWVSTASVWDIAKKYARVGAGTCPSRARMPCAISESPVLSSLPSTLNMPSRWKGFRLAKVCRDVR